MKHVYDKVLGAIMKHVHDEVLAIHVNEQVVTLFNEEIGYKYLQTQIISVIKQN